MIIVMAMIIHFRSEVRTPLTPGSTVFPLEEHPLAPVKGICHHHHNYSFHQCNHYEYWHHHYTANLQYRASLPPVVNWIFATSTHLILLYGLGVDQFDFYGKCPKCRFPWWEVSIKWGWAQVLHLSPSFCVETLFCTRIFFIQNLFFVNRNLTWR